MPQFSLEWTLCDLKTNKEHKTNFSSNAPQLFLQIEFTFVQLVLNKSHLLLYFIKRLRELVFINVSSDAMKFIA